MIVLSCSFMYAKEFVPDFIVTVAKYDFFNEI